MRPHAGLDPSAQLAHRLVVAVKHQAVPGHARGQRHVQLASGGHVQAQALGVHEARHGDTEERLGCVGHLRPERGHSLAAAAAQVLLVVDEQRRPVGFGHLEHIASPDDEPTL